MITVRVHLVHLMNAKLGQEAAANPHTKPTDLGHKSSCKLLESTPTSLPHTLLSLTS